MHDEAVSASLYRRQADNGDPAAMAYLGRMYEDGRGGLAKDDAEAVLWYRRGAEAGNGSPMASLAYMYERGVVGWRRTSTKRVNGTALMNKKMWTDVQRLFAAFRA